MTRVDVLGVGFDPVDLEGAVARAVELVVAGGSHLVITANVEMVMRARHDACVRDVLQRAALVVADGVGVVWGSRQLGRPLPSRVPGIDLAARLCREAVHRRWRLFLLGGQPGVAAGAADQLHAWFPGIEVVGTRDGYFAADAERVVVSAIRDAGPTLLLAGLGAPRQERWLARHLDALGVPLAMGIGGALDVWTGRARRAPRIWQTLGLEWCYRLAREPRRFGRQLAIPYFMAIVYGRRLQTLLRAAPR